MAATILTWVEKYWPYSRILVMLEEFNNNGFVDQIWPVRAHKQAKKDTLAFFLKQGPGAKGIFGAGILLDDPSERQDITRPEVDRWRSTIRFNKLCDPKTEFFIPSQHLVDSGLMTQPEFEPRSSGQALLSADAEKWIAEQMATAVPIAISEETAVNKVRRQAGSFAGTKLRGRKLSAAAMATQAFQTAAGSYGQEIQRTIKNKNIIFRDKFEMEKYLLQLIDAQDGLCAISRIQLQYHDEYSDRALLCSLDRIDSNGHYEPCNLQVVCQFINGWKGNQVDDEFRRLISIVRSVSDLPNF